MFLIIIFNYQFIYIIHFFLQFGVFFGVILFVNVGILCIFRICHKLCEMKRMRRIHTGIRVINCSIRKLWILSTIDRMFYPLILYPIYLTFGN